MAWRTDKLERPVGSTSMPPRRQDSVVVQEPAPLPADESSAAAVPSEAVGGCSCRIRVPRPVGLAAQEEALTQAAEADLTGRLAVSLAGSMSERSTCAAVEQEDDASDASTTASVSEPPPESPRMRWADLADSEDEAEDVEAASSSAFPATAWVAPTEPAAPVEPSKPRARWADISDSDDEQVCQLTIPEVSPVESSPPESVKQGGSASSQPPASASARAKRGEAAQSKKERSRTSGPRHGAARGAGPAWGGSAATSAPRRGRAAWAGAGSTAQGWKADQAAHGHRHSADSHSCSARNGMGWSQAGCYSKPAGQGKRQCQFMIGIEEEPQFQVKRKVLGPHGHNMKAIAEKTGAKLRLRGRGSGFLEGPEQREASDPLMLCVSAPDACSYGESVRLLRKLLEGVHESFRGFCKRAGQPAPDLRIDVHEGPRPGSF